MSDPSSKQDDSASNPKGALRWSTRPPLREGASAGRASSIQGTNALDVLLRWTEDLDDERAVTLWAGLSAVEDPAAREAALLRWVDWAGVTFPLGLKLRDLVAAVGTLSEELERTVRDAERVYQHEPSDLLPMTRALLGWMRARETQPGVVLGAARAIVLARDVLRDATLGGADASPSARSAGHPRESFEVIPASPGRERLSSREVAAALRDARGGDPLGGAQAMLFSALRRRIERAQVQEAAELLLILLRAEPGPEIPPWILIALDFVLLDADLNGDFPLPLAHLAEAAPALWSALILDHHTPRSSLRAMRLVTALSRHEREFDALSVGTVEALERSLIDALENARWSIWARAARALGRLCAIERLGLRLLAVLDEQDASSVLRRRAFAALGNLSPRSPAALRARRDEVLAPLLAPVDDDAAASASEATTVAALSVGLPDLVTDDDDDAWLARALAFAARGGPEAWMVLSRAVLEIRARRPAQADRVARAATAVRARAEAWTGGGVEAERAERAVALAARVMSAEELRAPATLLLDFAAVIGRVPSSGVARATVDGFAAELDVLVGNSSRAISQDVPRTTARACMLLEEIVDLLVDGDLEVAAHRIADGGPRAAALSMIDGLRVRLLKMVWSGLRRPTPRTFAWRRWLVRTAAVLPRVAPTNRRTAAEVVRDQVFETLERLAEDPLLSQAPVQRYTAGAIGELSASLRPSVGEGAEVQVLAWMALRGAITERHLRMRRWLGDAESEAALDQLFALIESASRAGRDVSRDLQILSGLLGDAPGRLAKLMASLAAECAAVLQRRAETHWSGLARFDLSELAGLVDTLAECLGDVTFALTADQARSGAATRREPLAERAAGLNRLLTATSLKFVDAARRAEVVEHYLGELSTLCEAIASSCGALLAPGVRGLLAKSLVTVRELASDALVGREDDVRYIGRLKVLGELSSSHEGGMATTYLGEGPAPGKKVVVKLLPWERFRGKTAETARALFEGEMQRLAQIVHPNIVSIVDAGFIDEGAFIAVEYIPGASLETLLRKLGAVRLEHVGPVILDAARALAYLHGRGVIHRDVKPANVLMQADLPHGGEIDASTLGSVEFVRGVLIDFGIATEVHRAGPHEGVTGTPGYIAPEVARGLDTVGPGVDVYSLAVVIFEMLTGANPYLENRTELNAVLVAHATESPPWQRLPQLPRRAELIELLRDATRLDPRQRISMRQFIPRWESFLRG
ncbi:MAG: serine/threonine-protein kinase [Polyangiales bacterium]